MYVCIYGLVMLTLLQVMMVYFVDSSPLLLQYVQILLSLTSLHAMSVVEALTAAAAAAAAGGKMSSSASSAEATTAGPSGSSREEERGRRNGGG